MQHLRLVADSEAQARSLKACLEYLYEEALAADLKITANLIGAAAESLQGNLCEGGQKEALTVVSGGKS